MGEPARALTGTYRLQLHAGFTLADAAEIVPYVADLGVSHLYLSPILQAAPGSMHGYDVVDHSRVSDDLGGQDGLVDLADTAHHNGLGVVCDVVPNHMCIPEPAYLNRQVWDVLRYGRDAPAARWFDVDWDLCDGKLGLPILGDILGAVVAADELSLGTTLVGGEEQRVLRYYDQVFPVSPGTEGGLVSEVVARQHYLLGSWRDKRALLGHRRFFDVDTLIAVRVEDPDVWEATHAVLVELHRRGVLDGFRIDHPDGLADPEGYLARFADATDDAWVVVEKILAADEHLPPTWRTAGSTGYDALTVVQTALTPSEATDPLVHLWSEVAGDDSLHDVELAAKRQVLDQLLMPEFDRLARLAERAAADTGRAFADGAQLRASLAEALAHVEIYRAYVRLGHPVDAEATTRLDQLFGAARKTRPDLSAGLDLLQQLVGDPATTSPAGRDLVVRFQQVCGPVMAKGVEDTTFYRFDRLLALNEVGGDPDALLHPGPAALHESATYQSEHSPQAMTTLSTHDTKRSEDVRARLLGVAADPNSWVSAWQQVHAYAHRREVDEPTAYLVFQTLLGTWPIEAERLHGYAQKAIREAKQHTSWQDPDEAYEARVRSLIDDCLADADVDAVMTQTLASQAAQIATVTLGAKLLQLTLPGVPDVYQGTELVTLSLVDPDNRRPVDFDKRRDLLRELGGKTTEWSRQSRPAEGASHVRWSSVSRPTAGAPDLDVTKLWVTRQALHLRRDHPEAFGPGSSYTPVDAGSDVVAFVRSGGDTTALTVVRRPGGAPTTITLPAGRWRDVLAAAEHSGGPADVFGTLPVALLVREAQ